MYREQPHPRHRLCSCWLLSAPPPPTALSLSSYGETSILVQLMTEPWLEEITSEININGECWFHQEVRSLMPSRGNIKLHLVIHFLFLCSYCLSSLITNTLCNLSYTSLSTYCFFGAFLLQSEEEVVDPFPKIKEECGKHCPKQLKLYEACKSRIAASKEGDCESWYFDYLHCVDHCAAPKIFKLLK